MIPGVFASDHTDTSAYGTVEVEKSQYELRVGQSIYVKVFGTVENPGSKSGTSDQHDLYLEKILYFLDPGDGTTACTNPRRNTIRQEKDGQNFEVVWT